MHDKKEKEAPKLKHKRKAMFVSTLALSALLTGSAFAAESTPEAQKLVHTAMNHIKRGADTNPPAAFGKITAIQGTSITITGKSNTSYTVDASNAKFYKGKDTVITIQDLKVSDMIVVEGTLNGATVTATSIRVGGPKGVPGGTPTMMIPRGVMGTVSTVTGSTFTVTTPAFKPHMGHASSSTSVVATTPTLVNVITTGTTVFKKDGATSTLAEVTSGARVMVEGTKDAAGTTITASKVLVITKNFDRGPRLMGGHMMEKNTDTTSSQ